MNIKRLLEEFLTSKKTGVNKTYVEIFKNPTKKEMNSVAKYHAMRFIASPRSILYVFSPQLLHAEASYAIDKEDSKLFGELASKKAIGGVASNMMPQGFWRVNAIHNVGVGNDKQMNEWLKKNGDKWKWLSKYKIIF